MTLHEPGETAARHPGAILAIILISYLMIILDVSIVITGLPKIREELSFTTAELSWVQSIYTLTFGGFLLLGARAGDILGRRKTFQAGLVIFTLASLAIGVAQSAEILIIARGIQGFGAAILAPSTLALLSFSFAEGRERTRATAWYGSTAGIGAAFGLVLGGVLADTLSWRVGFFINLPIGLAMIFLGARFVEETVPTPGKFDLAGAIGSTLGFGALIWGVVSTAERGWSDTAALSAIGAGALIIVAFVLHEARAAQPIMPLRLFASRERVGAYGARFLYLAAMVGFFFFTTQFLQGVDGFSPLQAGLGFLPMTLVNFAVAMTVPRLTETLGNRTLMLAGLAVTAVGMIWLAQADAGAGYVTSIALPMALIGAGQGFCFGPLTASGIAGTRKEDAGAASGLVNVAHQMGMSFGLAFLVAMAALFGGPADFAASYHAAMTTGAILLLLSLVIARALIPRPARAQARFNTAGS
ncbi:MFS transporter [Thioclava sp. SK-1]|uniref:MFS transporter n=1 Tax=Thioclava sp. SK-1 TaxID=1889770 RepID=UPI00082567DA|nr:MFS transporter [Thioclava sp. SK-1]OCX56620.1 MFS transporter [Thioclava sp. SK-1]